LEQNEWWKKYKNIKENGIIMQKGCFLNICHGKHPFITLLEDWTLDVQEDEHNNYLSLRMSHDSSLELAKKQ
jgi:hypothetical protein